MRRKAVSREALAPRLADLPALALPDLKALWIELTGNEPPARIRRDLLLRAVAYRLQEQVHGGLGSGTRRRLLRAAENASAGRPVVVAENPAKPGTRLLREWQGVTHEVIVEETGVRYRGTVWPSLSAVAREITGARRSGPRFFGLKEPTL